jgi:hypothetical protein
MKPVVPKSQRCAIYTRKSSEHNLDLEFNSLDAQREALSRARRMRAGASTPIATTMAACLEPHSTARPCKTFWPMSRLARSLS